MRRTDTVDLCPAFNHSHAANGAHHWYNDGMDDATSANSKLVENIRAAFGLQRFGLDMMRQNLMRRFPDESSADIDARVTAQLLHRPEAEFGDGVGVPGSWPRRRP